MKLTGLQQVGLVAAMALAAVPAGAQEREHSGRSEGRAVQRNGGETQRGEAPRRTEAPAAERRAEPAPRAGTAAPAEARAVNEARRDGDNRNGYGRGDYGRAVPRPQVIAGAARPVVVAPRVVRPVVVGSNGGRAVLVTRRCLQLRGLLVEVFDDPACNFVELHRTASRQRWKTGFDLPNKVASPGVGQSCQARLKTKLAVLLADEV